MKFTQQSQELVKDWVLSVQAGGDYTAEFDVKGVHAGSTLTETVAAWDKSYSISMECYDDEAVLYLSYSSLYGGIRFYADSFTGLINSTIYTVSDRLIKTAE